MHEHYEDCPWREQALYTMDSRNQMLSGYYALSEYVFPRASLVLISKGVRPDGLLSLDAFDGKWLPKESREELYGEIKPKDFFSKGMLFIFAFSGLLFSVIFELCAVALMLLASGIAAIARQSWEPFIMLLDWSIYLKIFLWCFFGGGVGMVIAMLWETRLALGVVALRRRRRKRHLHSP
jgi:hypothetical protein